MDGDVDLIVARNDGLTVHVREGDVFRTRRLPVELPQHSVPLAVAVSDIDHDGDLYVEQLRGRRVPARAR